MIQKLYNGNEHLLFKFPLKKLMNILKEFIIQSWYKSYCKNKDVF